MCRKLDVDSEARFVPLTISTAVGAATIVGERERGTGEFLAHSPAGVREIYLGKLIASLIPGYFTTIVGFGFYVIYRRRLHLPLANTQRAPVPLGPALALEYRSILVPIVSGDQSREAVE